MLKLYIAGATSLPIILLFNLYNRQPLYVHVVFSHILVLAVLLSLTGLVAFLILKRFIGAEKAIVLLVLFWAAFWFFGALRRYVFTGISGTVLVLLIAIALALVLVLIHKQSPPLDEFSPVFGTLSVVLVVMLLINATPAFYRNLTVRSEDAYRPLGNISIRRDFDVNHSLPMPDIYWIHLDGMVSLRTFEDFWGVCQGDTRNELARRGFLVYEDSYLRNAAGTTVAMPMLLSPSVYDNFFGELLGYIDEGFGHDVRDELYTILAANGLNIYNDINPYFELLVALLYRGYKINGFNAWWNYLDAARISGEDNRSLPSKMWNNFVISDLPHILLETTPIPLGLFLEGIFDTVYLDMPETYKRAEFTWIFFDHTHSLHWYQFDNGYDGDPEERFDLYPRGYMAITATMLSAVDEIRHRNPNAVIVLQSDHGLHRTSTQLHLEDIGTPKQTILELAHSVFSAIRIPETYGGLDAPVHPLNVTRILVNRFVGENYKLLGDDYLTKHRQN